MSESDFVHEPNLKLIDVINFMYQMVIDHFKAKKYINL